MIVSYNIFFHMFVRVKDNGLGLFYFSLLFSFFFSIYFLILNLRLEYSMILYITVTNYHTI